MSESSNSMSSDCSLSDEYDRRRARKARKSYREKRKHKKYHNQQANYQVYHGKHHGGDKRGHRTTRKPYHEDSATQRNFKITSNKSKSLYKYYRYSSEDSVCGIPKPSNK